MLPSSPEDAPLPAAPALCSAWFRFPCLLLRALLLLMGFCLRHCTLHHFIVIPSEVFICFSNLSFFCFDFLLFFLCSCGFGLFFHLLPICSSVRALLQTCASPSRAFCFSCFSLSAPFSHFQLSVYRGAASPVQPMVGWPCHEELQLLLAEGRWG